MELLEQHRELVLQSLAQQEACLRVLDRKIKTYRRRQSETQAGSGTSQH